MSLIRASEKLTAAMMTGLLHEANCVAFGYLLLLFLNMPYLLKTT